ncbi:hypothetical protein SJAG_05154 [Schizosaccharomyces japonicus yFS275]|uniref:Uncharacterized protein n=1 Tax=Schizosaccharomyces japonicus (strain yFS275 / FY16936) TaxID=402676 RepID=B6K8H0_SCHJY|nr:hypothetical protein SJAG_05154 [Schizosaccharomyces japonicus yFS275]EEB05015.2 hypothetical protein SJAG_05154 [Schizosaccharomyces japonicus yFS275]
MSLIVNLEAFITNELRCGVSDCQNVYETLTVFLTELLYSRRNFSLEIVSNCITRLESLKQLMLAKLILRRDSFSVSVNFGSCCDKVQALAIENRLFNVGGRPLRGINNELKAKAKTILQLWFALHLRHPYPQVKNVLSWVT